MSVQTQAICMDPGFSVFYKNRKLKKLLALFLVASVLVVACCAFTTIALVSSLLGVANSMGVFGDGELSEYIGYASILGSMAGMAGNMVWPGGGIGGSYGVGEGMGIGYTTETYDAAQLVAGGTAEGFQASQGALDQVVSENGVQVTEQMAVTSAENTANAATTQGTVTADANPTGIDRVQTEMTDFNTTNTPAPTVTPTSIATPDPIFDYPDMQMGVPMDSQYMQGTFTEAPTMNA